MLLLGLRFILGFSLVNYISNMRIDGSVCIITGGTSGIGESIAYDLLANNAKVAIWGRN